ncbi:hypothetical protein GCM10010411_48550 [Actinomadura fulvescens]|uniref:Uncharacterized protein n=1 Tax=Actinomadura fulvescens TaxID=46160 RepID=A0ABN3PYI4_9ACTN
MARVVYVPAAPPLSAWETWRLRRRLDALRRALHREGWATKRRYDDVPRLLQVYAEQAPHIGESVTVVRELHGWWYVTSSGVHLAPCTNVEEAAGELAAWLAPWVSAALGHGTDGVGGVGAAEPQ